MSKLLSCLDNAATVDSVSLEQSVQVLDKTYMAQLIEVQHKRGATGGDKFYSMLTDGKKLAISEGNKIMNISVQFCMIHIFRWYDLNAMMNVCVIVLFQELVSFVKYIRKKPLMMTLQIKG